MQIRSVVAPVALTVVLAGSPAWAEDPPPPETSDDAGETESESEPEESEEESSDEADELQELRDQLELMKLRLGALEAAPAEVPPPVAIPPNVFNPRITGFIDLVGSLSLGDHGVEPAFDVRAFELDFRADIDPFAKAVVVLGFENPLMHALEAHGHEDEDEDEEGHEAEEIGEAWLSVVEEANISFVALPAHLLLELGMVRVDFGGVNRSHLHDVPHLDYPGSTTSLLGGEGWNDAGAFLRYRLHNPRSAAIDFKVGVMSRGPEPLMTGRETPTPIVLGRFNASGDFGAGSLLSGGASYATWRDATSEVRGWHLAGADFLLKVRSPLRGQYNSLYFQGEAYFANRYGVESRNSLGGYLGLGFQPTRNVFLSLRGDALVDDLSDPEVEWGAGFAASLYTTEFLRIRLAYDLLGHEELTHRLGLQVTAVFGSHPVEPYWVNR
ncbi:MAG: hypothetical protein GY898_34245 [Proteobacteria bacterium]|nr:hypothetical protein [Pseudomonadota bacterium]